jgi:hypothetical protein
MNTEHQVTLAQLQTDFPSFLITREATLTGPRYIARSRHRSQNPHTLITADPAELRAHLAAAQHPHGAVPTLRPTA